MYAAGSDGIVDFELFINKLYRRHKGESGDDTYDRGGPRLDNVASGRNSYKTGEGTV